MTTRGFACCSNNNSPAAVPEKKPKLDHGKSSKTDPAKSKSDSKDKGSSKAGESKAELKAKTAVTKEETHGKIKLIPPKPKRESINRSTS